MHKLSKLTHKDISNKDKIMAHIFPLVLFSTITSLIFFITFYFSR
jgi:hypothetical protein